MEESESVAPEPASPESEGPPPAEDAEEEPLSGEDAIKDVRGRERERQESAISGHLVDEIVRRLSDVGQISLAGTSYTTYIGRAEVGGGLTVGGEPEGTAQAATVPVPPEELTGFPYAEPPGFAAARAALESGRLVLLRGAAGTGRRTAALRLAGDLGGQVSYLRAEHLATADFERRTYIVPGIGPAALRRLDEVALQGLVRRLDGSHAKLIITVEETVVLPARLTVIPLGAPSPIAVAAAHGTPLLHERFRAGFTALLPEVLPPGLGLRETVAIAVELARAMTAGTLEETLLRLADRPRDRAAEWFTGTSDRWDRAFAVAVAVLHGGSRLSVTDAAVDLCHRLEPEQPGMPGFRHLLADPLFTLAPALAETPEGAFPVTSLAFSDERTRLAFFDHAWTELDADRTVMLRWLRELGAHRDPDLRARAAVAAGLLALHDFPYAH